jgi:hypothetical protein
MEEQAGAWAVDGLQSHSHPLYLQWMGVGADGLVVDLKKIREQTEDNPLLNLK